LGRHGFEALLKKIGPWEAELPIILSQAGAWDRDNTKKHNDLERAPLYFPLAK
jgi:hypothetical protein